MVPAPGITEAQLLTAAAAVEKFSSTRSRWRCHARRAGHAARRRPNSQTSTAGRTREDRRRTVVLLGNRKLMERRTGQPRELAAEAARLQGGGRTVVHVRAAAA